MNISRVELSVVIKDHKLLDGSLEDLCFYISIHDGNIKIEKITAFSIDLEDTDIADIEADYSVNMLLEKAIKFIAYSTYIP